MKNENPYENWKKQRSQIDVAPNFTKTVMEQVSQYEQRRKSSLFTIQWIVDTITAHPLVQAAMIALGSIVGFVRLATMLHMILYA